MTRILISNDDGAQAPGFVALREALATMGEVWAVAPEKEQSAQSHSLTMHKPLRVRRCGERWFSVSGTPADCVYLGLHELMPEPPDVVVSGINRGANLGTDVFYSGTVAAAREACLAGVPSIALSLYLRGEGARHWQTACDVSRRVTREVLERGLPHRTLLNVNVPNVPVDQLRGIAAATLSVRRYGTRVDRREDPWGRPYYWIGGAPLDFDDDAATDGPLCEAGYATVTPMHHALTHTASLGALRDWTDA